MSAPKHQVIVTTQDSLIVLPSDGKMLTKKDAQRLGSYVIEGKVPEVTAKVLKVAISETVMEHAVH